MVWPTLGSRTAKEQEQELLREGKREECCGVLVIVRYTNVLTYLLTVYC